MKLAAPMLPSLFSTMSWASFTQVGHVDINSVTILFNRSIEPVLELLLVDARKGRVELTVLLLGPREGLGAGRATEQVMVITITNVHPEGLRDLHMAEVTGEA